MTIERSSFSFNLPQILVVLTFSSFLFLNDVLLNLEIYFLSLPLLRTFQLLEIPESLLPIKRSLLLLCINLVSDYLSIGELHNHNKPDILVLIGIRPNIHGHFRNRFLDADLNLVVFLDQHLPLEGLQIVGPARLGLVEEHYGFSQGLAVQILVGSGISHDYDLFDVGDHLVGEGLLLLFHLQRQDSVSLVVDYQNVFPDL